jgi:ribonuclease HI
MKTIYVDGYCTGNPGPCGCRGIMDGIEIFKYELGQGTNNVAEFYAVAAAINYALNNGFTDAFIFSDSTTAISWFNSKQVNSTSTNENLYKALTFIRGTDIKGIKVGKWDTRTQGQIPADYGHKLNYK